MNFRRKNSGIHGYLSMRAARRLSLCPCSSKQAACVHFARKCTHAVGHSRVGGVLILDGAAVRPQVHLIRQGLFPANVFNHLKSRADTANVRTSAPFPPARVEAPKCSASSDVACITGMHAHALKRATWSRKRRCAVCRGRGC